MRADVGAPVAADLGLVAHAAERGARELAAEGARDRAAERRLADARRAHEAEDRCLRLRRELAHREVLEDPVLHLLEVVVVVVEDLPRVRELELVRRLLRPREIRDPLEVGAEQVAVGRVLRERAEAAQLALGVRARLGRELGGLEPLRELVRLAAAALVLAELLLDLAHALAQEALAALRVRLVGLALGAERLLRLGDRDLALERARRRARGAAPDRAR